MKISWLRRPHFPANDGINPPPKWPGGDSSGPSVAKGGIKLIEFGQQGWPFVGTHELRVRRLARHQVNDFLWKRSQWLTAAERRHLVLADTLK